MAVPAVWRLINLLAFIEPKQHAKAHRRDACAPLQKSKSYRLLVLFSDYPESQLLLLQLLYESLASAAA